MMFEFQGRTYGVFFPFLKGFWTIFVEEVSLSKPLLSTEAYKEISATQNEGRHKSMNIQQLFFLKPLWRREIFDPIPNPTPPLLVLLLSLSSTSPVHGSLFFALAPS